MKTLANLAGGALIITEDAGNVKVTISKAASLGGGKAAGLIKAEGEGSVELEGEEALMLAEAVLNSKLPATVLPVAEVVEGVANSAVKALE